MNDATFMYITWGDTKPTKGRDFTRCVYIIIVQALVYPQADAEVNKIKIIQPRNVLIRSMCGALDRSIE